MCPWVAPCYPAGTENISITPESSLGATRPPPGSTSSRDYCHDPALQPSPRWPFVCPLADRAPRSCLGPSGVEPRCGCPSSLHLGSDWAGGADPGAPSVSARRLRLVAVKLPVSWLCDSVFATSLRSAGCPRGRAGLRELGGRGLRAGACEQPLTCGFRCRCTGSRCARARRPSRGGCARCCPSSFDRRGRRTGLLRATLSLVFVFAVLSRINGPVPGGSQPRFSKPDPFRVRMAGPACVSEPAAEPALQSGQKESGPRAPCSHRSGHF